MGTKLETIKVTHEYERSTPVTLQPPTQFGRNDSNQLFYQACIFPTAAVKIAAVLIWLDPHLQQTYGD